MIHVTRKRNHVAPRGGRRLDRQSLCEGAAEPGSSPCIMHVPARPRRGPIMGLIVCVGKPITDPACGCSLGMMVYASELRHSWPSNRRLWTASCGLHVLFHLLMSRIWTYRGFTRLAWILAVDLSKTLALKKQSATLLLISITILITIISFTEIPLSVLQTTVLSYCNFIVINISNCCMHTQCLANYSVQIQSRHYKRKAITPSVISSFTSTLYKRKKNRTMVFLSVSSRSNCNAF